MNTEKANEKLFSEFPPTTKQAWIEKATADLKGGEFNKKLVWKTLEGFDVQPFYTQEDMNGLGFLENFQNQFADNSPHTETIRNWENRERIKVTNEKEANETALFALNNGADGVIFDLTGSSKCDLKTLLANIFLDSCSISFVFDANPEQIIKDYFSLAAGKTIYGNLNYDPVAILSTKGKHEDSAVKNIKALFAAGAAFEDFNLVTVNSAPFAQSGANHVQEIAFTLSSAVEIIERLVAEGVSAADVIKKLEFNVAVGGDYFMEIAKFRALRMLFFQIAKAYGANIEATDIKIGAVSSVWTKTIFDPHVNMLRNTTEAMSAIIGGCSSVCIDPYDAAFGTPNAFSRRISRNISTILKEESYFDRIVDPAAGSYYLENLTNSLAEKAWALFQEVEAKGGYVKAFKEGFVQSKIKEVRDVKLKEVSSRRKVYVGSNQYPNLNESVDPTSIKTTVGVPAEVEVLAPLRAATQFEAMRLDTEKYIKKGNKRPDVYLALYGNLAMRKARAAFAQNFFGTAGFSVTEGPGYASVDEAVKGSIATKSEIVVICSSDDDYLATAEEFVTKFKAGSKQQLVLAGFPADITEKLTQAGIDGFIHIKSDAIDTLRGFQKKLGIV